MFNLIFKSTLIVCLSFLCLFVNNIQATTPNIDYLTVLVPADEIFVTVIGFEIHVESSDDSTIITGTDLYDSSQQLVNSERYSPAVSDAIIDINGLSSGYYVLQVLTTNGIESFQLYLQ